MISKRKLKERLADICSGAGITIDDEGYFDYDPGQLECIGNLIQAIERSFDLPETTRLRTPWRLKDMDVFGTLTDLVHEAIEYDKSK